MANIDIMNADIDVIKAFIKIENLLVNGDIEEYSYKSGTFTITVEIGDERFPDYDKDTYTFQLDYDEVLANDFIKTINEFKEQYYQMCKEAWEEEHGVEQPIIKTYHEPNGEIWHDYL